MPIEGEAGVGYVPLMFDPARGLGAYLQAMSEDEESCEGPSRAFGVRPGP